MKIEEKIQDIKAKIIKTEHDPKQIAKNEKSNVKIKISYKNLLKNVEEVKLDNVKVTITLTTNDGEEEEIVIPITGDSIHLNIIALIISIVVFIYCLSKLHINNKVRISLIVMMGLLIPSIIFAQEKVEVGIEFNSILSLLLLISFTLVIFVLLMIISC